MITEIPTEIEDETAAPLLDDPLGFARRLFEETLDADPRLATHARTEFAVYDRALDRLRHLHPNEAEFDGPLTLLDEAALTWGQAAFLEGARFALEADRLRRSLLAMATEAGRET